MSKVFFKKNYKHGTKKYGFLNNNIEIERSRISIRSFAITCVIQGSSRMKLAFI